MSASKLSILVFFGNERLATGVMTDAPTLRALVAAGYHVAAVVSHYERGKSRTARDLEIAAVAEEHGIPLLLPDKPAEIADQLASYGAEAAVLVAYGKIVPQSVIDIFPRGIINIHPSLLPLHRGPIPLEAVMLEGATETGVSIMRLAREMDAGPVYGQVRHYLTGSETKQALADTLLVAGGKLLLELLPAILDGSLEPVPQDDAAATYDNLLSKDDGQLDFSKPAARLESEIRAYAGWPGSRTLIGGKDVVVTAAHAVADGGNANTGNADNATVGTVAPGSIWRGPKQYGFYCADGILVIDKLKPAGKPEMTVEAFLAGHQV